MSGRFGGRHTSTTTTGRRGSVARARSSIAEVVGTLDDQTLSEAERRLRDAGMLGPLGAAVGTDATEQRRTSIAEALKAAAGRFGTDEIPATGPGFLDAIEFLTRRFCAEPDGAPGGGLGPRSFGAPSGRWERGNLTIAINPAGCTLPPAVVTATVFAAFNAYQAAEPFFSFTPAVPGGRSDINVRFGGAALDPRLSQLRNGALGSGAPPQRGTLNLLADVGLPNMPNGNPPFAWTQPLLAALVLHEAGHVLGLSHSTDPAAVMYPFAPNLVALDAETRRAITSLYGWSPQRPLTDRASTHGPALATVSIPSFTSRTDRVLMAWKGTDGDTAIYWSESADGIGWGGQQRTEFGTSGGPSIAAHTSPRLGPTAMMAWQGVPGDSAIYTSVLDGAQWTPQDRVPDVGTSARPALVEFNGQMVMAWKGVDGDSAIYWSTLDPGGWRPQAPIAGRGTSLGPALVVHNGRLWMFWKGVGGDTNIFQAELVDPANGIWGPQAMVAPIHAGNLAAGQQRIPIGSSDAPTAISRGDEIVLLWKGVPGDSTIWFARTDAGGEFSGQVPIADVGTAGRPGLVQVGGRIVAAWRGIDGDSGVYTANLG
ncbi:matrixin family metalloprotease [Falsiroseomonas oryzae]|uniref:matrixin family metalloprotease n=1 Tax=Falsiroseomonas oryzae TaxID=2766473 RepID=UPI0022EA723D|nr:matrixin family metalloprotease [Roseomonas sp. MO-31]